MGGGVRDANFLRENLATALFLQGLVSFALFLALIGAFFVIPTLRQDTLLLVVALFYTVFSIITNFLYSSFQAVHRMHLEAIAVGVQQGLLLIFVLFFLFYHGTVEGIMFGYLGASVFGAALTFILIRKYLFSWMWRIDWQKGMVLLSQSWPLMVGSALSTVYFSFDSIMLRFFQGSEAVGIYSALYKIVLVFYLFATLYGNSIFPVFSQLFTRAQDEFMNLYKRSVQLMAGLGFLFGLTITLFARPIIQIFFGEAYLAGTITLQVIIWSIMIFLVGMILYDTLIVAGKQKELLWSVLISTSLNVILNFILIPSWDMAGAAVATVIAQVAQLLLNIYSLRPIIPLSFFFLVSKPAIMAGGSVVLFFALSLALSTFAAAVFAIGSYITLLFIGKIFQFHEIRQVAQALVQRDT